MTPQERARRMSIDVQNYCALRGVSLGPDLVTVIEAFCRALSEPREEPAEILQDFPA